MKPRALRRAVVSSSVPKGPGIIVPIPSAGRPSGVLDAATLSRLGHSAGNKAVLGLLARPRIQRSVCGCGTCSSCGGARDEEAEPGSVSLQRQDLSALGLAPAGLAEGPVMTKRTLRFGSKGPDVVDLQTKLNQKGSAVPPLVPDGDFGPLTHGAVTNFQRTNGLVADRIVGPKTHAALDAVSPQENTPLGKPEVLDRPGSDSPEVIPKLPNVFGFPGKAGSGPPTTATPDDVADEKECAALPAAQEGAAINEVLSWQSTADDSTMLLRLAEILCFPPAYRRFVVGIAVALLSPQPGTPQREAMLQQMTHALDDFAGALEFVKNPGMTAFGLPPLSPARAERISNRIIALRAIASAQSSQPISGKRRAAASLVAGEVGRVDHKLVVAGRRLGADRLLDYFSTAFGGTVPAAQERTINKAPKDVKNFLSCAVAPDPCDPLAPWCGIFASWALQSAGISLPAWNLQDGKGLNQRGGWRQLGSGDDIKPEIWPREVSVTTRLSSPSCGPTAGQHTIHFKGSAAAVAVEATYNLVVKKGK